MPCDDWPGVFELEALALEIRLNDPRTERIKLDDVSFQRVSRAIKNPPQPNAALVELMRRR